MQILKSMVVVGALLSVTGGAVSMAYAADKAKKMCTEDGKSCKKASKECKPENCKK